MGRPFASLLPVRTVEPACLPLFQLPVFWAFVGCDFGTLR